MFLDIQNIVIHLNKLHYKGSNIFTLFSFFSFTDFDILIWQANIQMLFSEGYVHNVS